jgi:hypothetical protein
VRKTTNTPDHALEVTLLWGTTVVDRYVLQDRESLTIGWRRNAQLKVFDACVGKAFDLVTATGGAPRLHVPPEATALVHRGDEMSPLSGAAVLATDEAAFVQLRAARLRVRWIARAERTTTTAMDGVDFHYLRVLSLTALVGVTLLVAFWITPLNDELLADDVLRNPSSLVTAAVNVPAPKPKPTPKLERKPAPQDPDRDVHRFKAHRLAEPSEHPPEVDAHKRDRDRLKANHTGILQAMHSTGGALDSLLDSGSGAGINDALGRLKGGASMGDVGGLAAFGSRGAGPGGYGTALGIGTVRTKGGGAHGRGGYGDLEISGKGKSEVRVVPGSTSVQGALSKDLIAKVIRQRQNEIKYCYQHELSKSPDLAGKVTVMFTIGGTGEVAEATVNETTLADVNVENCMVQHIRHWRFPAPQGGGQVFVTYPWVLRAAGAEE